MTEKPKKWKKIKDYKTTKDTSIVDIDDILDIPLKLLRMYRPELNKMVIYCEKEDDSIISCTTTNNILIEKLSILTPKIIIKIEEDGNDYKISSPY